MANKDLQRKPPAHRKKDELSEDSAWLPTICVAPWWEFALARSLGKRVSFWPGHLHYEWRGRVYLVRYEPMGKEEAE